MTDQTTISSDGTALGQCQCHENVMNLRHVGMLSTDLMLARNLRERRIRLQSVGSSSDEIRDRSNSCHEWPPLEPSTPYTIVHLEQTSEKVHRDTAAA
jgi:hypothetical protein